MKSRPADVENPSFDSLLDALRAVAEGELPVDTLSVYYDALMVECQLAQAELEQQEPVTDHARIALAAWALTRAALEQIPLYVADPKPSRMASTVTAFIEAMRLSDTAKAYIAQNAAPE